jgi:RimJ/RimL family protein N-acetyltransferase
MTDIDITHYHGFNNTPAAIIAVKVQLELLESGFSAPLISLFYEDQIILATIKPSTEPVGVMIWKHYEWIKTVQIHLSYVTSGFRRRGVYRRMWDELLIKARETNAKIIESTIHIDNHAMRAVAKSLGHTERSINLSYTLEAEEGK